ncbi:FapA family protein [Clostridium chrysemydis]|uniref:FapA family protein n=1 Tax=Clostridium chrysemydis TaxID=2665504 RepID=UPI0018831A00|nr:FapA family protein [Clostridium chrysemydis]
MVVEGKTIDECLNIASNEFGLEKKDIQYKMLKMDKCEDGIVFKVDILNEVNIYDIELEDFDCEEIEIISDENVMVIVNGQKMKDKVIVSKMDTVKARVLEDDNGLTIDFKASKDNLEGTLEVNGGNNRFSTLKKEKLKNKLILKRDFGDYKEIDFDKKKEEILNFIKTKNVIFGLDFEAINSIILSKEESVTKVIARGIEKIDDEEDVIELLYKTKEDKNNINYKVNFRNLNKIDNVKADSDLAIIHIGKIGSSGKDIFGKDIKKIDKKGLPIKIGEGVIREGDILRSIKNGRVDLSNGTIKIIDSMDISKDIDIESGNINFIGDININGNVSMGMTVSGGNLININKNVESAIIKSGGDTIIKGSVLNSKVIAGVENEDFLKYVESLKELNSDIEKIISVSKQLKNSKKGSFEAGKAIKLIIDQKFKGLQKMIFRVLAYKVAYKSLFPNDDGLIELLRNKLAGLGPLNIKELNEVDNIYDIINREIKEVNRTMQRSSNIFMSYCQDSTLTASGDIVFNGKGQYVSEISAGGDIIFDGDNCVCRGGTIYANGNLKAKVVGSPAGVTTVLSVSDKGKIDVDEFYHNTTIKVGNRKSVLDTKGKDLHAYLDKDGELIIEKLNF